MDHIIDEFPLQELLYHDEPLTADIVFAQDSVKEGPAQRGVQGKDDIYDEYDQCVQLMKNKRDITEFQDPKFPAQIIPSIADADQKPYIENLKRSVEKRGNKQIQWKRPTEFMQGDIKLFDNIEPNDIKQQLLGDCYLLGSVSALAEIPYYIERIFINKQFAQNGLYGLKFVHNGMNKQVALDDYIPCGDNEGPIFSKNSGTELWVLLIEKAYAKLYGNYKKIVSGMPGEAISDITGAPYEYVTKKANEQQLDPVKTWEFLQKHEKAEHIITAGSFSDARGDAHKNDKGVYAGHCYSILDNREVVGSDGKPDKIIKLRNPWGTGEWKGDWSDNSAKWTPQLKKDVNFSDADDGIFWMSLNDMVENYSSVYANLVNRKYDYWSIKLTDQKVEKTMRAVAIQVPQKVHGYLTITFKEKRMFTESHQYGLQRLLLAKLDQTNNIVDFVGATSSFSSFIKRDQNIEVNLEPGNYLAFAEADWTQQYDRHLVVGFYGSGKVTFTEQNFDQDTYEKEISTLFRLLAYNHPELITLQEQGQFKQFRSKQQIGGYQFDIFENRGQQSINLNLGTKQLQLNKQVSHVEKKKQNLKNQFDQVGDSITLDGNSPSPIAPKQQQGGQQSTASDDQIISTIKAKVSQFQSIKVGDKNTEVKCVTIQGEVCVLLENKNPQPLKFSIKYQDPNLRGVNFDINQPIALNLDSNGCKLLRIKQNDTSKAPNLNFQIVSK